MTNWFKEDIKFKEYLFILCSMHVENYKILLGVTKFALTSHENVNIFFFN